MSAVLGGSRNPDAVDGSATGRDRPRQCRCCWSCWGCCSWKSCWPGISAITPRPRERLSNAPPGSVTTWIGAGIATAATFFFVIGATIIIHEFITGDFLGFLPRHASAPGSSKPSACRRSCPAKDRTGTTKAGPSCSACRSPKTGSGLIVGRRRRAHLLHLQGRGAEGVDALQAPAGRAAAHPRAVHLVFPAAAPQLQYARQGYPDMVILIDDTRSMGEPDTFLAPPVIEQVKNSSDGIREKLKTRSPDKIKELDAEIAARDAAAEKDGDRDRWKLEIDGLHAALRILAKTARQSSKTGNGGRADCSSCRRSSPSRNRIGSRRFSPRKRPKCTCSISTCKAGRPSCTTTAIASIPMPTRERSNGPAKPLPKSAPKGTTAGSGPPCARSSITIAAAASPASSCSPTASPPAMRRSPRPPDTPPPKASPSSSSASATNRICAI